LTVAPATKGTIDLLDGDGNINTTLNDWAVNEDVDVLQGFVDVFENKLLRHAAIGANELHDLKMGVLVLQVPLQFFRFSRPLANDANPKLRILLVALHDVVV
jgi:hypothetical protein